MANAASTGAYFRNNWGALRAACGARRTARGRPVVWHAGHAMGRLSARQFAKRIINALASQSAF